MAEYIGKYENAAAIQSAVDGGELVKPYVALDENTGMIDWNTKFIDYANMPLTLKITSDGDIKMNGRAYTTYSINGSEFKYLPNASVTTVNVVAGDVIILKNTDTVYGRLFQDSTAGFIVFGNLQYYKTGTTNACSSMFRNCTGLTDASNLVLPAITLEQGCYLQMFYNCTSLTKAPQLPATTLANNCYGYMFQGCTSLTTAPALPATTLANNCYGYMFQGCTSLTTAPVLPATTLEQGCYLQMFYNCTSLTKAPELPATNLADSCYQQMFADCTSLTTAPTLPATTLASTCYYQMFQGCTSLETAPELPATTLTQRCYQDMFQGCSNLNYIKCLATQNLNGNSSYWVRKVASTGTFVKAAGVNWPSGISGIPNNWTVIEE